MIDPDEIIDQTPRYLSPELRLWVSVLLDCLVAIRNGRDAYEHARKWVEDPGNGFFDAAAEALGHDPDSLQKRIRGLSERKGGASYFRRYRRSGGAS